MARGKREKLPIFLSKGEGGGDLPRQKGVARDVWRWGMAGTLVVENVMLVEG